MADKPLGWLNPRGPSESAAFAAMDPATAEQCKLQLVQQHSLFKQQTAALASAVQRQVQLANEIPVFIEEDGKPVQIWNPLEAVKAEIEAAQAEGDLCHILIAQTVQLKIVLLCCSKPWEEQLQLHHKLRQRSLTANTFVTGAQKASEAVAAAAPTTSTVTSPETKTSRLLPEQEQVLLRFFGAQDRVDHREAALLARQVRISTTLT